LFYFLLIFNCADLQLGENVIQENTQTKGTKIKKKRKEKKRRKSICISKACGYTELWSV